jgi:hypothetical protein
VKVVPTFAERRCHVVSVTDPYGGFLDQEDRDNVRVFLYLLPTTKVEA